MTDLYELALIAVVLAAGYWGLYFVRNRPHGTVTYGTMLLAAAGLAAIGWSARNGDGGWTGIAGAVGVGAATCLLVLGPLARSTARWLAANEHFGAAQRMLDVADVLAPGAGAGDEKALLGAMREIRDGNIEQTVDALVAAKHRVPAEAKLAIDERIAMLYLAAYRWDDAITHAEENLFGALPDTIDGASERKPLRSALGIAPPVWVELLGAYGRTGDLDRAAAMMARLEDACAGREDAAIWLHRGRLMFLALAGRVAAVEVLVEPRRSRHMTAAARTYWLGVAHERKGDGAAAEAAYAKARSRSRGRPREMIDQALARLAGAKPAELSPLAIEIVARVEASPPPTVAIAPRAHGPWTSRALAAAFVAVSAVIAIAVGPLGDIGVLVRAGALVRGLVDDAGEWWRFLACTFVHASAVYLVVSTLGLLVIGRLAGELYGNSRALAIFALAALGGAFASYAMVPDGVFVGSSGAIFGLLGAAFVELLVHRARYRTRAGVPLVVVALATIALVSVGFADPAVDTWAHAGGLGAGIVAGALLSPHARWKQVGLAIARAIGVLFVAAAVATAVLVVRHPVGDTLDAMPRARRTLAGVSIDVPAAWWGIGDEVFARDRMIIVALHRAPAPNGLAPVYAAYLASEGERAKSRQFARADAAHDRAVALPERWQGDELIAVVPDALGNEQRYRVIVAGRIVDGDAVLASVYAPDTVVRAAPAYFARILASVQP